MNWGPGSHGLLWRPWEVAQGGQDHAGPHGACGFPACLAAAQVASGCHCGSLGRGCSWARWPSPSPAGSYEHPHWQSQGHLPAPAALPHSGAQAQ